MKPLTRRHWLSQSAALTGAALLGNACATPSQPDAPASTSASSIASLDGSTLTGTPRGADDERWWARVAAHYDLTPSITAAENGNWGVMARPVLDVYLDHSRAVNRDNSYFARRDYGALYQAILQETTARLGAQSGEVAFTRGATEALQNLITGYRGLTAGDKVMYADLDYGSMQAAMRWKARQSRCEVVTLKLPEPASLEGVLAAYEQAFDTHPETRLLLLTHISHRTGLAVPIAEITRLAKTRNIDVIVDAAHSWGQLDFSVDDLGADFIGFNLHKWVGAPLGVGAMYIRQERLEAIAPHPLAGAWEQQRISGRTHTGTSNFAAYLTLPAAFAFQDQLGNAAKAARLRYLRNRWVSQCQDLDGLQILTPNDERLHAGITSFRIKGMTSVEQNKAIAAHLLEAHQVFAVHRDGVAAGACVRITPGYFNSATDMDKVAAAIRESTVRFAS